MTDNMSLREFKKRFEAGEFDSPDFDTQCKAGWYDWFCKDESLHRKTKVLGKKVLQLFDSPKVNQDTMYVFFKNNCPMRGKLYDDFRLCDLKSGDVLFTVIPTKSFDDGKDFHPPAVWGKKKDGGFDKLFEGENWEAIKEWFYN